MYTQGHMSVESSSSKSTVGPMFVYLFNSCSKGCEYCKSEDLLGEGISGIDRCSVVPTD